MKISKVLAGISAMAVAATMALSASAATTISVSNPNLTDWGSAFPKWTDGTQQMDDYIDGKTFTKGQPLEVKVTYEYTQDAKDAFADDDPDNNYAILKPCHAAQGWTSLVQEGFIEGLNEAGTWDYAEVGYTIKDTGETVPFVAQSSEIITNDPNNNVITFTISAAGVDAMADAANASAEAYDGIQIQVFGIDIKSIELSQDGVQLASQYSGGQSSGDVSTDSTAASDNTTKPGTTTSTNSTASANSTASTGSTSTNKGTTASTSTADKTANTGATAGLALAGLALAGAALVVSKKK